MYDTYSYIELTCFNTMPSAVSLCSLLYRICRIPALKQRWYVHQLSCLVTQIGDVRNPIRAAAGLPRLCIAAPSIAAKVLLVEYSLPARYGFLQSSGVHTKVYRGRKQAMQYERFHSERI